MAFMHEESTLKIVHRDIKTTNVLLDRDLKPKISDFGLAKLDEEENTHFSTQALVLQQRGNLMELVDPKLGSEFNKEEAIRMIKVALLCTNPSPALRPTMSAVVSMLEGRTVVHENGMDPSIYGDELRFKALKDQFDQILQLPMSSNEADSLISNATWIGSSTSTQDFYPLNLDSR
ncbi:isoform 2 of probable lrr receptor-like serine/threonine-protein kinase [Fagus crenata]